MPRVVVATVRSFLKSPHVPEAYEGKIAMETGKCVDNNRGVVFVDVASTCQIEIFIGWQHWLSLKAGRCQRSAWSLEATSDISHGE
jgi:hypothetical protein